MPQSFAYAQALPLLGAIVAFLFAALLILYIFRLLFGQRIRPPAGPRSRQKRMDVVDTFELGRDRQLVVVRRDNVEHLLLIGGPNDLVVERAIPRADMRDQRAPQPREKEAEASAEWPTPPSPAPKEAPPPGRIPVQEPPRRRPVEAAAEAAAHYAQHGPSSNAPLTQELFAPAAPQRPAAAQPAGESPVPRPAAPGLAPRPPVGAPPPQPRPASPPFLARTPRVVGAPQGAGAAPPPPPKREAPPQPSYGAAREGAAPLPPREPTQQKPQQAPAAPEHSADPLDSLEAEMARLLGRPDQES